jgi:PAS domain-containing protein
VSADARTCERLGLPPDQPFPPERFEVEVHPDDHHVVAFIAAVRASSGPDGWDLEYRRLAPDGRVTWHQSIARAWRDGSGRVTRISGISLDITRRKAGLAEEPQGRGA